MSKESDTLSFRDVEVLRESVWHALQRADIPYEDVDHLRELYSRLSGTKALPPEAGDSELLYDLARAEHYARAAHDLLYKAAGPQRSMWFRMLAGRAQSILMGLYVQEVRRDKENSR